MTFKICTVRKAGHTTAQKYGALALPAPPDVGVVVVSVRGERRGERASVPEIWPVSEPSSNHSTHTELMDMVSSS